MAEKHIFISKRDILLNILIRTEYSSSPWQGNSIYFFVSEMVNSCLSYFAFLQKGSKTLWKERNDAIFLLRSRARSLCQGETVNFFFSKKKKLQKEVGNLAGWPLRQSTVTQELFCSRRCGVFREIVPTPESKGHGIFADAPILSIWLARWCVSERTSRALSCAPYGHRQERRVESKWISFLNG